MPDNPYAQLDPWAAEETLASEAPRLADYCSRCGKLDKEQAHMRVYCPRCHEVCCGGKRQGEWIAFPHYRNGPKGKLDRIPCIGGPIDPKEDRAP